jgi:hypothetical protein
MNNVKFETNYEWFKELDSDLIHSFPPRLMDFWCACKRSEDDALDYYEKLEQEIENDLNKITNYDEMIVSKIHYEDMSHWLDSFLWRTNYKTTGSILQEEYYNWVEQTLGIDIVYTSSKGLRIKFLELYNKNDLRKLTDEEENEIDLIDKQERVNRQINKIKDDFV